MMNKLVFNNLNVNKFYFNNKNINKLYLGKNLIYNNEVSELSDLVALGILPKPISEYTDADISSIISIPYTDSSGKILLNNGGIEFEVVGVNHHRDINNESKPTITLMTKNIIRTTAFDANEPRNYIGERDDCGNNRWAVSNIRQWLNSEGAANEWFTKQHGHDEAPTKDYVDKNIYVDAEAAAYADDPGFLVGFSDEIKQHFATVRNKTIVCKADVSDLFHPEWYDETKDKVFLPSYTEMGFGNLYSSPEGNHLEKKFKDDKSRIKIDASGKTYWDYWTRSPYPDDTINLYSIYGRRCRLYTRA